MTIRLAIGRLHHARVGKQEGFILVAALTLMAVLVMVGATTYLVSSTNAKVGGNFKTSQITLQVAMAGIETAREKLRVSNAASANMNSFSEELAAHRGSNSQLDNPLGSTDDYNVLTTSTTSSTMTVGSTTVSYVVYITNDAQDSNGWQSVTDSNQKALLTSIATGPNNSKAIVQAVIKVFSGATAPAAVYSKGDVTGNGNSLTISGVDECGVTSSIAPIYTKSPAITKLTGNGGTLSGSPSTAQTGTTDLNIAGMISELKSSASYTLTQDTSTGTYGSATDYKVVYSNTSSPANVNGLMLNNVTGYGVLLIDGDLELGGGFTWYGPILVTGSVTLNGGGGGINVHGQILSGTSTLTDITINGGNVIKYNSCEIAKAFTNVSLPVANWKQVLN